MTKNQNVIIGKDFPRVVIPLIDQSKKSIDILVFDWRWYSNDPVNPVQLFNQAIVGAVRRGVKVSALVNFSHAIPFLLDVGVDVQQYKNSGILHSKIIIIDKKHLILGSHNLTQSAFSSNVEVSILLENFEKIDILLDFVNNIKK